MEKQNIQLAKRTIEMLLAEKVQLNNRIAELENTVAKHERIYAHEEIKEIVNSVCEELGYNIKHVCRKNKYTFPRFYLAHYLRKSNHELTLKQIGKYIGIEDHSSVIYNIKQHNVLLDTNYLDYINMVKRVQSAINRYELRKQIAS